MRIKTLPIIFILFTIMNIQNNFAQETSSPRKLLAVTYPFDKLHQIIIPGADWKPFPTYANPDGLVRIPEKVRQAHIEEGERILETEWKPLPASVFLDYVRNGNRSRFEALSFERRSRLANLVLAELFERKGRFMDQILNGVWAVCEESFWGVPAHIGLQRKGAGLPDVTDPAIDLFAAETGVLLAWTHYLIGSELEKISPLITERIEFEINRRILTPYLTREDWGWMGFEYRQRKGYARPVNNWNPWINSNVLAAALIIEKDETRRLQLIRKVMNSVDNFIEPYPADGGCDEGPSYWNRAGASLFDCLELLYSASNGAINFYNEALIQEMGRYIYRTYIGNNYFTNFADAPARMELEAPVVYRFGKAIGDVQMQAFAAHFAQRQSLGTGLIKGSFGCLNRQLPALFSVEELRVIPAGEPFLRDVWFSEIQVMIARSIASSKENFFLAAKGGHNDESHNHNDVGNFIVYFDGLPVLIDAGAATYTAKTFSSQRYALWNNQSAYHNLPTINGVMQKEGREFTAENVKYQKGNRVASISLELAKTYPSEAFVKSWQRKITLNRGQNVLLQEKYQLEKFVEPFTLSLMTPVQPTIVKPGKINLPVETANVTIIYDPGRFEASYENIELTDSRMQGSWGKEIFRIVLVSKKQVLADEYSIRVERSK
ncbi:heparinase II/III family protein [candidate division KSB1 bacterium]|nr:heparinase II/III family protein [candidate division KSB1 bacterium]